MMDIARTAGDMISGMSPELRPGEFVFATTRDRELGATLASQAISAFREDEGLSLIIPVDLARRYDLNTDHPMRRITLNVFSALDGVGLTSAVATALGEQGIPCNMVAAFHHDHIFVPSEMAQKALGILTSMQDQASVQE